jgi:predicted Zn finger-like uncharacterized protein
MTLATRCPWCETVFRLSKDQAAVRAGMVRCGICGHTFNALDYLVRGADLGGHAERIMASRSAAAARPPARGAPASAPGPAPSAAARITPSMPRDDELIEVTRIEGERRPEPADLDDAPIGDRRLAEPSFLRQARDGERAPMSRGAAFAWLLLNLVALLLLIAQTGYFWRGPIFAAFPDLSTLVAQSCAALGCQLDPPADIDLITIESSALEPAAGRANVVTFSTLLRNHSPVSERYPAIELTLTDAEDHPTVRRVLMPRDYLGRVESGRLDRGLAANSEAPIKVLLEVSNAPVVGYRTRVFYP